MRIQPMIAAVALVGLSACASQTEQSVRDENQNPGQIIAQGERIAPGKCRVLCTVVAIDSSLEASGPCAKAPCRAVVRVDSILGYGSAFGNPIAVRGEIPVRFAFTLAPTTNDLFPSMTEHLPGLALGSKFRTDLESRIQMKNSGGLPSYEVYGYAIVK